LNYKAIIKCEIAPLRNIAAASSCHSAALRICLTSPWTPSALVMVAKHTLLSPITISFSLEREI
jgi:hypothetical protein